MSDQHKIIFCLDNVDSFSPSGQCCCLFTEPMLDFLLHEFWAETPLRKVWWFVSHTASFVGEKVGEWHWMRQNQYICPI